jgi:hypothetical protein
LVQDFIEALKAQREWEARIMASSVPVRKLRIHGMFWRVAAMPKLLGRPGIAPFIKSVL